MAADDSGAPVLGCWVAPTPDRGPSERLVAIEVHPPEAPVKSDRAALDLMLVVDRSSSMVGPRIAAAVEAVRQICLRLTERDRLGVLAFDSSVETIRSPGPVTAETATEAVVALTELGVGYGTNLSGAWSRGAEMLNRGGIPGASKTVLLLTDGLPSRGARKTRELEVLVKKGSDRGIVTSTVGIGERFDETLLSRMAVAGGGSYRFAERDEDTTAIAEEEVAGLEAVVAEAAVLHVGFARSVRRYEVLHELPCQIEEDGLAIELRRLYSAVPRVVLLEIEAEEATRNLGVVGLSCLGTAEPWGDLEPARILLPAPGQEAQDASRVGAAWVPLLVARWQQKIWERGRDASMARLMALMSEGRAMFDQLPEELTSSEEAVEAIERFKAGCDRIVEAADHRTQGGEAERRRRTSAAFKSMSEESTQTVLGITRGGGQPSRRRRGWGKK